MAPPPLRWLPIQDVTGRRVNKVVKSITCVEEPVNEFVDIWGKDPLAEVEVLVDREKTADEKLVSGPQIEGDGISQDDIDKLFDRRCGAGNSFLCIHDNLEPVILDGRFTEGYDRPE